MQLEDLLKTPEEIIVPKPEPMNIPDYMLNDPEIVGYPDVEMQDDIYRWVENDIRFNATVKDFGCGRGDFGHAYLKYARPNSDDLYIGIDKNPFLIEAGIRKWRSKYEFALKHGDWFDEFTMTDYTVCIGSLNEVETADPMDFFFRTLTHALQTTKEQVIFVFNTEPEEGYNHFPLDKVIDILSEWKPFRLDCSRYKGICKLTVFCNEFEL